MIKNYFKIALRTLRRQAGYTFINMAGLGAGMAVCLLILLYVQDELRFDRFHEHANRIYRIVTDGHIPGAPPDRFASTSFPVAVALLTVSYQTVKAAMADPVKSLRYE